MFPRSTLEYVENSGVSHIEQLGNLALTVVPFGIQGSYLQHLRFIQFRVVVSLSPWSVIAHDESSSQRYSMSTLFLLVIPHKF